MRKARKQQLPQSGGLVHEFWQLHNREFHLDSNHLKQVLYACLKFGLTHQKLDSKVKVHAYCFMGNHCHQVLKYVGESYSLSFFMKLMNGEFARRFHKIFKSSGAVNNGRPKTIPIEEHSASEMRAHMYVEANPLRARICRRGKLRYYRFNSYRYYAYGIRDEYTEVISPPKWYISLGATPSQRQRRYRRLFEKYITQGMPLVSRLIKKIDGLVTEKRHSFRNRWKPHHEVIANQMIRRIDELIQRSSIPHRGNV